MHIFCIGKDRIQLAHKAPHQHKIKTIINSHLINKTIFLIKEKKHELVLLPKIQ
jgi:hypothetical protein